MPDIMKKRAEILEKLRIERLTPMQEKADEVIQSNSEVILLSPTGTGKTLAFLLPVIECLSPEVNGIQVLIVVPSRELALQILQVVREMGAGYKANAVYGGRAGSQDKIDLKHPPAILIGTPGRLADHLRRENFSVDTIKTIVFDEFDKSMDTGFEVEMREINNALHSVNNTILTSATKGVGLPKFVRFSKPVFLDYLKEKETKLVFKKVISPSADVLPTLVKTLSHIGNQPGIVFCNFKDTIEEVSTFLHSKKISHACFHGGMEQVDRERALIKFRNGTHQLLVATDLAARGIDVPEIKFIIHFQLPNNNKEFIHRNGRTARMNSEGTAYILNNTDEELPDFVGQIPTLELLDKPLPEPSAWQTLYITGGRRDKISKGDIAGLFFKKGMLTKDEVGVIELMQDCAYVGILQSKAKGVIALVNNTRLKKKKVRVSIVSNKR